ncbi:MAG: tyrosine-type recombinase/integrase [Gemmatimonadota bacterium]
MPTLAEFSVRYLDEHAVPHKKARTVLEDRRNLKKHILPALGRVRIDQLTRADVLRFHNARRAHGTLANRLLALLSHMCTMAEKWALRPDGSNPCRHVPKFKESKRQRFLSEAEIGRLAVALTNAEKENGFAVAAIRLALFVGARRNEVLTLRWEDVHLARGVLELPDSKTGAKPVYLNAPAKQLLSRLPRVSGNAHVFPGRIDGAHLVNIDKLWRSIRDEAEIPDVRLHDLRHSFASVLVSGGASLSLIGGLLGHTKPSTTQRYAHLSSDPLKAAAERAGEVITAAMKRGQKKRKASR